MNYSFIENCKPNEFINENKNKLYTNKSDNNNNNNNKNSINSIKTNNPDKPNDNNNNINYYAYEQEQKQGKNNWKTENSIHKSVMKGTIETSPLGELYFSEENINRLQEMIKYEVYERTKGKYLLQVNQNETDLLIVMRDVYLTDAVHSPYKIIHQVKVLNKKTIEKIVPDMISMIKQDEEYVKQLDRPIIPIPLPVNVNRKGRLQLPSTTNIFMK